MATPPDLSTMKLTFDDEFSNGFSWNNGGSSGTWKTLYVWGGDAARTLPSNGELEYYADPSTAVVQKYPGVNPFTVSGGVLDIAARPSPERGLTQNLPYVSGLITTEGLFSQKYGYFEMRAKLPEGQGLWPAFWLLPQDHSWPPEIDVMEGFGSKPNQLHTATHSNAGGSGGWTNLYDDLTNSFHTFGMHWTSSTITWYLDGKAVRETPTPSDMHKPMYLLANLAVGGHWPGAPFPDTPFPAHMQIDYIRAYSSDPAAVAVPMQTISPAGGASVTAPAAADSPDPVFSSASTVWTTAAVGTSGHDHLHTQHGDLATRYGGRGDDTYVVTDSRMAIVENANEGIDRVLAWMDYTLPSHVENIKVDASYGNVHVYGNALSNFVEGSPHDDWLDGRGGDDVLTGGGAADVFTVRAGHGYDTITDFDVTRDRLVLDGYGLKDFAAVQAALVDVSGGSVLTFDNGETLSLRGVGRSQFSAEDVVLVNISGAGSAPPPPPSPPVVQPFTLPESVATSGPAITGGSRADKLKGTKGNDLIDGMAGADTMTGQGGHDSYVVDNSADKVVEQAGAGIDTVLLDAATYTLASNVENLVLRNSIAHTVVGNGGGNIITATDTHADTINAGAGTDILRAGRGGGMLTGGADSDMFVFRNLPTGGFNTVTDFRIGEDLLDLRQLHTANATLSLALDGRGGTTIAVDQDGSATAFAPVVVADVQHITPDMIRTSDLLW